MAKQNLVLNNSVGGELAPNMYGRSDSPVYQKGLTRCQNFYVFPQGGARFRNGFSFIKHTHLNQTAVFIPFQFSDAQAYLIELTNFVATFYTPSGVITEAAKNITGVTTASPGVFTSASHGYAVNDEVFISNVGGINGVNGRFFYINSVPNSNTFTLKDVFGSALNTTGTYTSGGTAQRVYKIATPWGTSILEELKYAQQADLMYLTHKSLRLKKLTRLGETSWTITDVSLNLNPNVNQTSSDNWARACAFSQDCRFVIAGTNIKPEAVFGSNTPNQSTGTPQFEAFAIDSNPNLVTASMAYFFVLASHNNKIDVVQWVAHTPKYFVVGTSGSVRRLFGADEGLAPNPLNINSKVANSFGADQAIPISVGSDFFYIERGTRRVRNLLYDFQIDAYETTDMNLVSDHIAYNAKQLCVTASSPDILWARRLDGVLAGLTFKSRENIAGWHRHLLGGTHIDSNGATRQYGKVINVGSMGRTTQGEQLWTIVERRINGATVRTVEKLNDPPVYPVLVDFFTGSKTFDETRYINACYEVQKSAIHLDSAITYDGSQNTTLTPGATTGTNVTFTAGTAVFTASMVGRQLWKKYDGSGAGGGRAVIKSFTNSTNVVCDILEAFDSTSAIAANGWLLTTSTVTGLNHLEGETVSVIADGAPAANATVASGTISLAAQASIVHVGLPYKGIVQTLDLDFGGTTGSAQSKPRKITKVWTRFLNTIGCRIGTDIYKTERMKFPKNQYNRGTPLFSGKVQKRLDDGTTEYDKLLTYEQDLPLPCTILAIDLFGDTTDE